MVLSEHVAAELAELIAEQVVVERMASGLLAVELIELAECLADLGNHLGDLFIDEEYRLARDSDAAIVGGVNLILTIDQLMNTAKLGILSPTSTCNTFDAAADGYVHLLLRRPALSACVHRENNIMID